MNKKLFISVLFCSALLFGCASQSQVSKDKENALSQKINEKVQAKNYEITVNYANPMRGKSIYLSSGYNLIVRNDSAIAYLPYYGVAYSAPYGGGDGGIKFNEPVSDYKSIQKEKSGEWDISFKVKSADDNYVVNINIFSNAKASLSFNSDRKQSISFNGDVKADDSDN